MCSVRVFMFTQVSVFLAILSAVTAVNPSLTEVRGPVYVAELARCMPADMYQLVTDALSEMADLVPEQPAGTALPVDKLGWFAQTLTKAMTGGRPFCVAYAMTHAMAVSRFSNHELRGAPLSQYQQACAARLSGSANPYAKSAARGLTGPMTVAGDELIHCLMTGSFVAEQTRLDEPSGPVK